MFMNMRIVCIDIFMFMNMTWLHKYYKYFYLTVTLYIYSGFYYTQLIYEFIQKFNIVKDMMVQDSLSIISSNGGMSSSSSSSGR